MILYSRTNWYGIGYFFSLRGSVLPRVVPAQVVSCLICFVVHKGYLDDAVGSPVNEWIGDTYAMQLFGVVFGYLCVTRINMSYSRYWEGTTMVKNMHSKWADACGQVLNFDRCASPKCDLTDDPFCCHIVRLFSQLSAMATMRLHVEEPGQAAQFGDLPGVEVSTLQRQQEGEGRKRLQSLFKSESDERASQMPTAKLARATTLHNLQRSAKHGTTFRNLRTGHAANGSPLGSPLHAPGGNKKWKSAAEQSSNGGVKRNSGHQRISGGDGLNFHLPSKLTAAAAAHGGGGCGAHGDGSSFALPKDEMPKDEMPKDELQQLQDSLMTGLTKDELTLLAAAPCPVVATAQRIQRAIITRQHAGGICAPPPIVSRIFQEISNGLLAYNNATKMKEVPVPFEYVQLNAYLLNTMAILAPIAISAFTASFVLAVIATFVVVGSFYAIFIVANDMEDPFGNQLNDMPMLSYHEEFCATIYAFLTNAWLPEDQWLVRDGPWVDPASLANTASAFWDSIGKKDQAKVIHVRGKIAPFASLLNNQKMVNSQPNDQEPSLVQRMIRRVAPPVKTHRLPHVLSFPGEQGTAGFEKKRVEKSAKVVQRYARGYLSRQTLLKRGVSLRKLPSGFCGAGSFSKGGGKARNSVDEKPSPVQVGDPSTAWEGGAPAADGLQTSTRGSRCGSCSWGRSSRCGSCSEGAVASRYSTGGGTASRRARFSSRDSMGGDGSSRGPMGSTKDMAARVKRGSVACAKSAKVAFAKVAPQPITIIQ